MPQQDDVLYPKNYNEPLTIPLLPACRDFVEAKRLIELAVPPEGPALSLAQIAPIVIGRADTEGAGWLHVKTSTIVEIRSALSSGLKGIVASSKTSSIRRRELDAIFDEIVAERQASWTFLGGEAQAGPEIP